MIEEDKDGYKQWNLGRKAYHKRVKTAKAAKFRKEILPQFRETVSTENLGNDRYKITDLNTKDKYLYYATTGMLMHAGAGVVVTTGTMLKEFGKHE